jgi:hypothetical protein
MALVLRKGWGCNEGDRKERQKGVSLDEEVAIIKDEIM